MFLKNKLRAVLKRFRLPHRDVLEAVGDLCTEREIAMQLLISSGAVRDTKLTITEGIQQLIEVSNQQNQSIASAQMALGDALKAIDIAKMKSGEGDKPLVDDGYTYSYFIPYDFRYTRDWNGGPVSICQGMTVINFEGGVRNWQQIVGLATFIKGNSLTQFPNAHVRINGIHLLDKWPTKKI